MKKSIILLLAVFSMASCKLEEQPKKIAEETFYNDATELEAGVYGIYAQLQRGLRKNIHTIPESQVDYGYARGSYATVNGFQGLDNTNVVRMSDIWSRLYKAIRDANSVIKYAPKAAENSPEGEIRPLVAEAKFLRAFSYFTLVRSWGGVPLRTEANLLDLAVPRASEEEVYKLILQDLRDAEPVLALKPRKGQFGRPTSGACKTLLADVYLHLNLWTDARNKALEVINMNEYGLVQVNKAEDFDNLFGLTVNGSSEEIFYLKFTAAYGNDYVNMGHYTTTVHFNNKGNNGVYTDSVKNRFIKEWDYKDLRKKYNFYNFNVDNNRDIAVNGSKTTLFYKKFKDPANVDKFCATDNPMYRYADLLLLYAEADCRASNAPTDAAMEALNKVHRRGYGYPSDVASVVDFKRADYNSIEAFLNLVLKERGYETIYEGKRYYDLKRMGKYAEAIKYVHGIDINTKILLFPIPSDELSYNEALTNADQNPGY